jgi:hypothetical protein
MEPVLETIEGRNIDIQVENEKIIIMIKTRYEPETYKGVKRIIVGDTLFSGYLLVLYPIIEHFVHEDMITIEIDRTYFTGRISVINSINVILDRRPLEEYNYNSNEFICLE